MAIYEYIEQIIKDPMDWGGHQEIANAYVMLYSLLTEAGHLEDGKKYCRRAIEEFKILCQYAPQDPWVHTQLAYGYHDLKMPKEEIGSMRSCLSCALSIDKFYMIWVFSTFNKG